MKHRVAGRKLGRTSAHRLAVLRNLARALFDKERVRTTVAKAKELRPFAERLVTLSKRETLHARRRVLRHIRDRAVVAKLFDTLSARYAQRPGGYTRILRLGPRPGDGAEMALIELVGARPGGAAAEKAPSKVEREKPEPAPAAARERRRRGRSAGPADVKEAGGRKPARRAMAKKKEERAEPRDRSTGKATSKKEGGRKPGKRSTGSD